MDNKTKELLVDKLATLAVRVGANVQKDWNFSYIITTTRKCTSKKIQKGSISCWRKKSIYRLER